MAPAPDSRHITESVDFRGEDNGPDEDLRSVGEGSEDEVEDGSISDGEHGVESDEGDGSSDDQEEVEQRIQNVSFGALKQAQDALSRKRKRGSETTADQEDKLEALRARLNDIRSESNANGKCGKSQRSNAAGQSNANASKVTKSKSTTDGGDEEEDSDSAPSEEEANTKSRSSKHAPMSQSSRHQVTRKRKVIDVPKRSYRDPRFDAIQQNSTQPGHTAKAYSFLRDYQKDEIAELKSAIKQARNEEDKEVFKRKMVSMQNRIKSEESKEREQEVLRQHRKEEKERVDQGKKPFYLKKKDLKERAMVEKFKGMKSKDREKLMEKRRRKEDQKEKRRMPDARRVDG